MDSGSISDDDPMSKRNKLMKEVVSMRRKVPKILISLDEKIQRKELKTLVLKEYPPGAVQGQLERYIADKSSCEGKRIPNLQKDMKSLKTAVANVAKVKHVLQEQEKNSIDFSSLIKKSMEVQKQLDLFNVAQQHFANENPLITMSRQEGYSHMMRHREPEEAEFQVP